MEISTKCYIRILPSDITYLRHYYTGILQERDKDFVSPKINYPTQFIHISSSIKYIHMYKQINYNKIN